MSGAVKYKPVLHLEDLPTVRVRHVRPRASPAPEKRLRRPAER